jgi:hypothetical protein
VDGVRAPRGTRAGFRCQVGSTRRPLAGGPTSPHGLPLPGGLHAPNAPRCIISRSPPRARPSRYFHRSPFSPSLSPLCRRRVASGGCCIDPVVPPPSPSLRLDLVPAPALLAVVALVLVIAGAASTTHLFYLSPSWCDLLCFSMNLLMLASFW